MNEVVKAKRFLIIFIIISLIMPGAYFVREQIGKKAGGNGSEELKIVAAEEELNESEDDNHGDENAEADAAAGQTEKKDNYSKHNQANAGDQNQQSGQVQEGTQKKPEPAFGKAPKGYFKDALFIGDSRTVGIEEYGTFKYSTFFCTEGMNVYDIKKDKVKVNGIGKLNLSELLSQKQFGKIYVMLGINELGYSREQTVDKFGELIQTIREKQADASIYIQANLHVTKKKSSGDKIFNNKRINKFNREIAKFADNESIFYIDVNEYFDDKDGNLAKDKSFDEVHPLGKYYKNWCSWIRNHVVQRNADIGN